MDWWNSSLELPLYSWMKRVWNAKSYIIPSFQRFNLKEVQWNKETYFIMKIKITNWDKMCDFVML